MKPTVKLVGEDGNVFSIIGRVSKTLKQANQPDKAKEFTEKAFASKSYGAVLCLVMEYCQIQLKTEGCSRRRYNINFCHASFFLSVQDICHTVLRLIR